MKTKTGYIYVIFAFIGGLLLTLLGALFEDYQHNIEILMALSSFHHFIAPIILGLVSGLFGFIFWKLKAKRYEALVKTKENAEKSEEKLRKILDAFDDTIYISNPDYTIVYLNKAMGNLIGNNKMGTKCYESIYNLNKKCEWCIYDKLTESRNYLAYDLHFPETDRYRNVRNIIFENNQKLTIHQDITERKQAEYKLKESEERYKSLFNEAGDYIFVLKLDNEKGPVISDVNSKALEKHGYTRDELIGMPVSELETPEFQKTIPERSKLFSKPGDFAIFETEHIRKDGTVFPVEVSVRMIQIANNEPFLLSVERDITERKKAEQIIQQQNTELQKLNADKDRFISILGHDLRNLFNNILGFSELLLKKIQTKDMDKIEKYGIQINQSTQLAFTLLEDLLMWAKAHSGTLAFNPIKVYLKAIFDDAISILTPIANEKNIKINYLQTHEFNIIADNEMIKTIIRNLISNAIKFTNRGGTISINAEQNESDNIISVTDNGVGMTPEAMNKLFNVAQTHTTPGTANERGTGLGLLLCKEFVEKHGGAIWVESEVGKGSEFRFTIPLVSHLL